MPVPIAPADDSWSRMSRLFSRRDKKDISHRGHRVHRGVSLTSVNSVPSVALCFQFLSWLPIAIMPGFPLPLHTIPQTDSCALCRCIDRESILVVRKTKKTLLSLCPLCPLWLYVFNSCPACPWPLCQVSRCHCTIRK